MRRLTTRSQMASGFFLSFYVMQNEKSFTLKHQNATGFSVAMDRTTSIKPLKKYTRLLHKG